MYDLAIGSEELAANPNDEADLDCNVMNLASCRYRGEGRIIAQNPLWLPSRNLNKWRRSSQELTAV